MYRNFKIWKNIIESITINYFIIIVIRDIIWITVLRDLQSSIYCYGRSPCWTALYRHWHWCVICLYITQWRFLQYATSFLCYMYYRPTLQILCVKWFIYITSTYWVKQNLLTAYVLHVHRPCKLIGRLTNIWLKF